MPSAQGRYWIGTIPESLGWAPPGGGPDATEHPRYTDADVAWIKGQQECGAGGLVHWQIVVGFSRAVRLSAVRRVFPGHWELTRSRAAEAYVWKPDTAIADTQFEWGERPFKCNSKTDWDSVRAAASTANWDAIPSQVFVQHYNSIRRIASDNVKPVPMERSCRVFWGATGTGKSRRAWDEAGMDSYAKDPLTKWWCGYNGEQNVVIDEFRGVLSIAHLLRWLDRYPVRVETKGASQPLKATQFWITSNLDPRLWYPDADDETKQALLRRLNITHFP